MREANNKTSACGTAALGRCVQAEVDEAEASAVPRTDDLPFARPACSAANGAGQQAGGLQLVTCLTCRHVLLASAFAAHAALCRGPREREWSPQPSAAASLSGPSGRASVSQARPQQGRAALRRPSAHAVFDHENQIWARCSSGKVRSYSCKVQQNLLPNLEMCAQCCALQAHCHSLTAHLPQ